VKPTEYKSTGYDRGHLAPSADFAWSKEANDMTFVMSNMVPQSPGLNRGAWKKLEEQVRRWACGEKKISVITGPILKRGLTKLKGGDLEVPQEFFKIIIDETPPVKMVSFLYNQTDVGDVMTERMMPINRLEIMAGITFNDEIPEYVEEDERAPATANEWKEADCAK
jgi:endonuclease G